MRVISRVVRPAHVEGGTTPRPAKAYSPALMLAPRAPGRPAAFATPLPGAHRDGAPGVVKEVDDLVPFPREEPEQRQHEPPVGRIHLWKNGSTRNDVSVRHVPGKEVLGARRRRTVQ